MMDFQSKLLHAAANLNILQLHVCKESSPINTLSVWSPQFRVQKRKCYWSRGAVFPSEHGTNGVNLHLGSYCTWTFLRSQRTENPELSLAQKALTAAISSMSACPWMLYTKMALHKSGWLELKDMMLKIKHVSVSGGFRATSKQAAHIEHTAASQRNVSFKGRKSCSQPKKPVCNLEPLRDLKLMFDYAGETGKCV